jgi:hypothetical protein
MSVNFLHPSFTGRGASRSERPSGLAAAVAAVLDLNGVPVADDAWPLVAA